MRRGLETLARPGPGVEHAGLVLDRSPASADDHAARRALLERAAGSAVPALYRQRYARWRATLDELASTAQGEFQVVGRLIVGLGNESTLETGITLQRVDGVPYIPGSALRGLARHYAERQLAAGDAGFGRDGAYARVLFGSTESAGYVTFFDAWYVPGSAPDDRPMALDTITVHHPHYYTGGAHRWAPTDLDDPKPVAFLSARGRYLVAVQGPDPGWARLALGVLEQALADWGAGAKTASGYGRLGRHEASAAPQPAAAAVERPAPATHPLVAQVEALAPAQVRPQIGNLVQQADQLPEPARSTVLRAVVEKLRAQPRDWAWAQTRGWWERIAPLANE